jgi:hypothetical protein
MLILSIGPLTDDDVLRLTEYQDKLRSQPKKHDPPVTVPQDILDILQELNGKPVRPTELRKYLAENGYWEDVTLTHKAFLAMLRNSPNVAFSVKSGSTVVRYKYTGRLSDEDTE